MPCDHHVRHCRRHVLHRGARDVHDAGALTETFMRLLSACLALFVLVAGSASAEGERLLPTFAVTSASGATVSSLSLSQQPRWLLIYVTPSCRSCDRLIESLKQWQSPALASRTVIVVRGAGGGRYIQDHTSSGFDVLWYADEGDKAWRSLELQSAPALIGIERGEIKWSVSGVLNDPKALEAVVLK